MRIVVCRVGQKTGLSLIVHSFRLRNDLYCVGWGVKLYSNHSAILVAVYTATLTSGFSLQHGVSY